MTMNKSEAKQKALDNYEEWISCTGVIPKGTGYYYECEQVVREAFEFGFNAERTRWIPVSDRLPDKDGDYLCIHFDSGKMCCDVLNYEHFDLMGRVSKKFLDHYYGFDFEATHWMPLPSAPYQEVE